MRVPSDFGMIMSTFVVDAEGYEPVSVTEMAHVQGN